MFDSVNMIPPAERELFRFKEFAGQPEYVEENRQFVNKTLDVSPNSIIVDLACGDGLVTRLIRDRFAGVPATIIGIDPNYASLEDARAGVPTIGETQVEFVEDYGQNLLQHVEPGTVDAIYMCNALHEVAGTQEKQAILDAAAVALRPGGKLFINSAFTREWPTHDDSSLWGHWKSYAISELGGHRDKSLGGFEVLSFDEYKEMIDRTGLVTDVSSPRPVKFPKRALVAISKYVIFIQGTFIDVPTPDGIADPQDPEYKVKVMQAQSNALISSLDRVEVDFRKSRGDLPFTLSRNWIEFTAVKPLQ